MARSLNLLFRSRLSTLNRLKPHLTLVADQPQTPKAVS
jgi:hypothetical protein